MVGSFDLCSHEHSTNLYMFASYCNYIYTLWLGIVGFYMQILRISCLYLHDLIWRLWFLTLWQICPLNTTYTTKFCKIYTREWTDSTNDPLCVHIPESSLYEMEIIKGNVSRIYLPCDYQWLKITYFVMLMIHLKSLVGNIVGMTHAIFKIETNVKKI
jgi:hypothetical protein